LPAAQGPAVNAAYAPQAPNDVPSGGNSTPL